MSTTTHELRLDAWLLARHIPDDQEIDPAANIRFYDRQDAHGILHPPADGVVVSVEMTGAAWDRLDRPDTLVATLTTKDAT